MLSHSLMAESTHADRIGEEAFDVLLEDLLQRAARHTCGRAPTLREWTEMAEAWWICQALGRARGNRSAAARALGIGRRTLYAKLDRYGIQPSWHMAKEPLRAAPPERRHPQ